MSESPLVNEAGYKDLFEKLKSSQTSNAGSPTSIRKSLRKRVNEALTLRNRKKKEDNLTNAQVPISKCIPRTPVTEPDIVTVEGLGSKSDETDKTDAKHEESLEEETDWEDKSCQENNTEEVGNPSSNIKTRGWEKIRLFWNQQQLLIPRVKIENLKIFRQHGSNLVEH